MVPIYRSDGAWVAVYERSHIFNIDGEWIGFVVGREVFDPAGQYLGFMSDDRRLLRKRSTGRRAPHASVPEQPARPNIPANVPLAPLLPELPFQIVDLFVEFPERLMYVAETRPDMSD
ncbi:MAG: 4-fold beta flower protein [Candidatus Promineifilaceae bacterium]